ncbi:Putative NAD(P)H nitroreductase [Rhizobiaceae bacterium]|nr:Putative NAD(P)H nitroreductase [Rhizobiaceae bacterium]
MMVSGGVALALPAAGCGAGQSRWNEAVAETWATLAADASLGDLVRYATLAANSHNTQPWRFSATEGAVTILPDLSRRTPVVDPDDHHLFVSLGCAAENLSIAAEARGRRATIGFDPAGDGNVAISLEPGPAAETPLFVAIPERQCTRSEYDGRAVPTGDLARLEEAARVDGVDVVMIGDPSRMAAVLDYVVAGNTRQVEDPAFVAELSEWLRFNAGQAAGTRDGLYSVASGNPTSPTWLGRLLFPWIFSAESENDRYSRQIRSSSGIAVFVAREEGKAGWVAVGRSYQRFALQATALGIRNAFVNQPIEVPEVRAEFAAWLGLGRRPDLVVRYGYAPSMPKSLRRPVADVMA